MTEPHRDRRLQRRQEEHDFRRIFQPLSLLFGVIGVLLFCWIGLSASEGQPLRKDLVGAGFTLIGFPVLVLLFRLCRGHFCKDPHV